MSASGACSRSMPGLVFVSVMKFTEIKLRCFYLLSFYRATHTQCICITQYMLWPGICFFWSWCSIEADEWIELTQRPPSACPTLCYKEIRVSPGMRVLLSGTLSQTLDLRQNSTCSISCVFVVQETVQQTPQQIEQLYKSATLHKMLQLVVQ